MINNILIFSDNQQRHFDMECSIQLRLLLAMVVISAACGEHHRTHCVNT